jgi:HEAT repeat protein
MSENPEDDRLLEILEADAVSPALLEGLKDFSAASKNRVAARIARTFEPSPSARMLARLILILTDENRADVRTALLANLRAGDPAARKASLYGLETLEHPGIVDLALNALRDTDDAVLVAACDILARKAKEQPQIRELLKSFYAAHKSRAESYGATRLLEAHGLGASGPLR